MYESTAEIQARNIPDSLSKPKHKKAKGAKVESIDVNVYAEAAKCLSFRVTRVRLPAWIKAQKLRYIYSAGVNRKVPGGLEVYRTMPTDRRMHDRSG
jgi:hypothetical protein